MKQLSYSSPSAGTYRLGSGIRITADYAICDYPLRAIRLNATARQLLLLCSEERTCQFLTAQTNLPIKRIEALCKQLCWKGLLEAGPDVPPAAWPDISIIIPTYNRADQLERCLHSLLALEYPAPCLEIIVVDDGSTDKTCIVLERLEQDFFERGYKLRVVRHTARLGVAKSRNSGAEVAHTDLLAYIDSDCVASTNWLAELVPAFQDAAIGAVGGMIRAYERKSLLGRYEDVRSSLFMGMRPQQVGLEGPLTYLPTANLLMRRELWEQIGGFRPFTFGEDVDFCRRLLTTEAHILYLPRGTVYHDYRTSLKAFLQIRFSYASSEAALLKSHPNERRILILPPEQAPFAALVLGGLWGMVLSIVYHGATSRDKKSMQPGWGEQGTRQKATLSNPSVGTKMQPGGSGQGTRKGHPYHIRNTVSYMVGVPLAGTLPTPPWLRHLLAFILAILLTFLGTRNRLKKVRKHGLPISPFTILRATLRGHLAYTYHLCRHLTRYYTLPILISGLLLSPLLILGAILCGIVIGVDYARLRPAMHFGRYALCSVLDDCAYEVGVVIGCLKQKTWKPLVPVIKRKTPTE